MSKQFGWGDICHRVDTCALTGAGAFIAGIPQSEVLVNGPLWCYFYALRYLERADFTMSGRFFGSQPDNTAVVYGAEKNILEALHNITQAGRKPELLLVESSCSLSLIGDDLAGIARKAQLPFPVITMDCGGMVGGFAEGYTKAAKKTFDVLLPEKIGEKRPLAVNIIGQTPFYLQGAADTHELQRILQLAGYEVLAAPGSGSSVSELRKLGEASLNVVTNIELGLPLAEYLKRKYGTPYVVCGVPYGVAGTLAWVEKIHAALPCPQLDKVHSEAAKQQAYLISRTNEARLLWGSLWFDEVLVSAPPTVALCMAQALRTEWADMGALTVICQQPLAQAWNCEAADAVYSVGRDDAAIAEYFAQCDNVLLLASSSESSVLYRREKCHFNCCNIAYPANDAVLISQQPMAGFTGSSYMLERLWNVFVAASLKKQGER